MVGFNNRHETLSYRMELFRKDCVRRKLSTWQERKQYAQNDKLWSKLIKWLPVPGKNPGDLGYEECPLFVLTVTENDKPKNSR